MKKTILLLGLCLSSVITFSQVTVNNGGFEGYINLPYCPLNAFDNTSITRCSYWSGLSSNYGSSCSSYADNAGAGSYVQYFNNSTFGSGACQPMTAHAGNGFAYCSENGFTGGSGNDANNELVYQTLSGTLSSSVTYSFSAYVNTLSNQGVVIKAWLVPTSVGSLGSDILSNIRSQSLSGGFQSLTSNWVQIRMLLTPPSTGTYYLVIGDPTFCNDGNHTIIENWAIDDVSFGVAPTCTANAGPNRTDTLTCAGWPGVTIGTASVTGCYYSWSPTTKLDNSFTSQPVSTWSNTTTHEIYTVTVTGDFCTTATSTVQVSAAPNPCPGCCRVSGISSNNQNISNFVVYPNPANNNITISLSDKTDYIQIIDMMGRLIFEAKNINDNEFKIDVSKYSKGIYFIRAKTGDIIEKQKLMIE